MFKIGIIGNGFVGKATNLLSNKISIHSIIYDINKDLCVPPNTTFDDLNKCQIIFICVPTPINKDNSIHLTIVEDIVSNIKNKLKPDIYIVIRSTVLPGTCNRLDTFFMPEFLTERNYLKDFKNNNQWIFGLTKNNILNIKFQNYISNLFEEAHLNNSIINKDLIFISSNEAEMIKYIKNTFLAMKVSYCNEIYSYCNENNIDYNLVKSIAFSDERLGLSHTDVPGPDGLFGFGGTCFPKDCYALLNDYKTKGVENYILKNVIDRNNNVDRKEKEWQKNVGRTVI